MKAQWPPKRKRWRPPTEAEVQMMNNTREFVQRMAPNLDVAKRDEIIKRIYHMIRKVRIQASLKKKE
jgi:hypothetical protein